MNEENTKKPNCWHCVYGERDYGHLGNRHQPSEPPAVICINPQVDEEEIDINFDKDPIVMIEENLALNCGWFTPMMAFKCGRNKCSKKFQIAIWCAKYCDSGSDNVYCSSRCMEIVDREFEESMKIEPFTNFDRKED